MSQADVMRRVAQTLIEKAPGFDVWRIGNDQSMCIEFGYRDHSDPERKARDWFDEHRVWCEEREYAVRKMRAFTSHECVMLAAANQLLEAAWQGEKTRAASTAPVTTTPHATVMP